MKFDGEGGWDFHLLNNKKMMSLNEEKQTLESQLAGVSKLEERLKEVNALLGMYLFSTYCHCIHINLASCGTLGEINSDRN